MKVTYHVFQTSTNNVGVLFKCVLSLFFILLSLLIFTNIYYYIKILLSFKEVTHRLEPKKFELYDNDLHLEKHHRNTSVQIVLVIGENMKRDDYKHAIDSMECYSRIHRYKFRILNSEDFPICKQRHTFFRRHCIVSNVLYDAEITFYSDADVGVVNPYKRIEDFAAGNFDLLFYDRFYNWEVAMGGYLARNTTFARRFLSGFADFEKSLPSQGIAGGDNGAFHMYFAEYALPNHTIEVRICRRIFNKIHYDYKILFVFENCIRNLIGARQEFGKIYIYQKGTAWVRDNWLTNSKWNPERDFMIHGYKTSQLEKYDIAANKIITIAETSRAKYYTPFYGDFELKKCIPYNLTWSYDRNLIASTEEIEMSLYERYEKIEEERLRDMAQFKDLI